MKTHFVLFLACYSKTNDSIYQHETIFFGKIRYLFLTYQKFVMGFCLIFSKYFLENMGFLYTPSIQWPMEAYSNGSKRYVYDTELKLRLCIKSVYNVKSLALTLSFPQAFRKRCSKSVISIGTPSPLKHPIVTKLLE